MNIAYLIFAHNNPAHLQRLIAALATEHAQFFIHIDKKSDLGAFSAVQGPQVHFTRERAAVYWGDFSQVEAVLILMRAALAQAPQARRLVLLSGVDYPLRSAAYIERFFDAHAETEFISLSAMPSESEKKFLTRLTTYAVRNSLPRVARGVVKLLMKTGIVPRTRDYRPVLGDMVPYAGATWWALTREAAQAVVDFTERETRFVDFFKNTLCPDEGMIHTIVGASPYFAKARRTLTYADWSDGGASPSNISEKHLPFFREHRCFPDTDSLGAGEMLFARKFSDGDAALLAKLDRQKQAQEQDA